jgi:flagellar hook-length control protein FliK
MSTKVWASVAVLIAAISITPSAAAERAIASKPLQGKAAHVGAPKAQPLASRIDDLLHAQNLQPGYALTIMSPTKPIRVSVSARDVSKVVTLIDAKTSAEVGQWTISSETSAADIATISTTVLTRMGLNAKPDARPSNKPAPQKKPAAKPAQPG